MHDHIRLLYCKACRYRFSERKGTPLFHTHLPEEKARSVLQHLSEGCGVRQTGRLVDVHRNSVSRLAKRAGTHRITVTSDTNKDHPLYRLVPVSAPGCDASGTDSTGGGEPGPAPDPDADPLLSLLSDL